MAIGSHQSARMQTDEWLTPPGIIEDLGPFDLDPCSPIDRPWDTAKAHLTVKDNGLWGNWWGRVWLNPPYGQRAAAWLAKMAAHNNGILMIFARTETKMFFEYVWPFAAAIFFMKGRLHFYHVDGSRAKENSGAPICLVAYDGLNALKLSNTKIQGKFIPL